MLSVYTLNDSLKWDEIVKEFSNYDVYYLSGYSKSFYIHKDGEPLLFCYQDDNGKAINVSMKRDIASDEHFIDSLNKNEYFDLATPYGYGGWLIEGNVNKNQMMKEYNDWCINNNIISEVIRFHPVLANQENVRDIYDVLDLGKTISLDLKDENTIWENIISKNRNVIRKAQKNNVVIKHEMSDKTINDFIEIYNQTMNNDLADSYYYFAKDFYESIKNDLDRHSDIFYAEYDNKVIASSIILNCNGKLTYHFSGQLLEYRSLAATNLLLYEVALWGSRNGYSSFHLGGGLGSKEDNLFKFKKSFYKGEDYQYSIGRKIFNEAKYQELVNKRKGNYTRDNYFPLYRA